MGMFDSLLNLSRQQMNFMTPPQPPMHKGMFGLHGTARDVLGLLGDALLMGGGGQPVYSLGRQNERVGDALLGMKDDPLKAIAGVAGVDRAAGERYYDSYLDSQDREATRNQNQQNFNTTTEFNRTKEGNDNTAKHLPSLAGYITSSNEKTWPQIRERVLSASKRLGVTLPYDLPEQYDPTVAAAYKDIAINPQAAANLAATNNYRTATIGLRDRGLDITETNSNKPKAVGSYTRDDGKKVIIFDDGTERESAGKVMPTGRRRRGGASASPAPAAANSDAPPPPRRVGDRIRFPDGSIHESKDGKTWS